MIFFGGGPNHQRLGFYYWQNPGSFVPYKAPGNTGNFLGFWYALIHSGFAFILSPELVAITAGESEAPRIRALTDPCPQRGHASFDGSPTKAVV